VGGKIIEDDDIAVSQRGRELCLDISLEDSPVHRPVHNEGCRQPIASQVGDEGLCLQWSNGA